MLGRLVGVLNFESVYKKGFEVACVDFLETRLKKGYLVMSNERGQGRR